MHRIVLSAAILALAPLAALAVPPQHLSAEGGPGEYTAPAGELCDFTYGQTVWYSIRGTRFFNQDGVRIRAIWHEDIVVEHRNLDTGQVLVERYHDSYENDFVAGTQTWTGNFWHLRDQDGRLVLVGSGRYVLDIETGELLDETPNATVGDFADTICTALGGAPANAP